MHDFVNGGDVPMLLATGGMLALAGLLIRGLVRVSLGKIPPVRLSRGQAWALLTLGAGAAVGFAWMGVVQFEDPWALSQARRAARRAGFGRPVGEGLRLSGESRPPHGALRRGVRRGGALQRAP